MRPHEPVTPGGSIADGIAEREAGRRAAGMQRAAQLQKTVEVARDLVETRRLYLARAIHDAARRESHPKRDPMSVCRAVRFDGVIPTTVLVAKIVCELGEIQAFVGIELRLTIAAHDDVGTGAEIGGHRGLRCEIFQFYVFDLTRNAGLVGELARVREPLIFVAL